MNRARFVLLHLILLVVNSSKTQKTPENKMELSNVAEFTTTLDEFLSTKKSNTKTSFLTTGKEKVTSGYSVQNSTDTPWLNNALKDIAYYLNVHINLTSTTEGPIERFQWRTTASYYMCWYTMSEVSDLKQLKEIATISLIAWIQTLVFLSGSMLSSQTLNNFESCWNNPANPCFVHNSVGHRQCSMNRSQNTDFTDIVLNRWNVTCKCSQAGYEWKSKYGICVDVDECFLGLHNCDPERESCVNLPGSFRCSCRWGFIRDSLSKICEASQFINILETLNVKQENVTNEQQARSIVKRIFYFIFYKENNSATVHSKLYKIVIIIQVTIYFII
ncbi:hypothetical protein FQR65_LT18537 [Abscondita terminalis]|nr:hypothetical protein FQR65_LT18537 [Abscondita terminalis]